jgi:hypothetical protein
MDRCEGTHAALYIALHGCLYVAIMMDRYERPSLPLLAPCMQASS